MATTSRPYDPEEYSFGDFAEAMNNNAAVDIAAANGTNAPVSTTPSGDMVAATMAPGETTPSSFTEVLAAADNGNVVQYGSAPTSETPAPTTESVPGTEVPETVAEGVTGEGVTEEGTITPGGEASEETVTSGPLDWIDTELGTFDTGATGTVTGSDLSWLPSADNTQDESKYTILDFENWQNTYSVDPVTEYKNAQAQLDYEYMTWMSTYGERAEQLFQMGLSNSGVSDIFGANAYSAYVQASIDLKRQQIQLQKQNKQEYQKYVEGIEAQEKADQDALDSKISAGAKAYLESYTPEKAKQIYQALLAQGYSESEAAAVIQKLDNYYYATPEEDRPDTIESNSKVSSAYNNYSATYKPENSQNIYNELIEVHGLTKQEAMAVIKKLQASYEANAPARFEADVNTATQWLNDNYYYGMTDEQIMSMLGTEYDEETVKAAMEKFAPYKNSIDALAGDEEASKAFNEMRVLISEGDTDIENLKAKIKSLGYSEAAIAKAAENIQPWLDEAIENQKKSNVDAATKWLNENYSYGMTDEELMSMLGTEYDEKTVKAAMEKFAPYKKSVDRLGSDTAARNAFDYMLNALNGGDHDIESLKAKAKAYGFNENAIAKAAENIQPWINEALEQQAAADEDAALTWLQSYYQPGWDEAKLTQMLSSLGYSDEVIEAALGRFAVFKTEKDLYAEDEEFGEAFNQMYEFMSGGDLDIDSLSEKLDSLGYSGAAIERAAEAITPFLEEAQEKQGEINAERQEAIIKEAMSWLDSNYRSGMTDEKLSNMLSSLGYSDDVIEAALDRFEVFKTEKDLYAEDEEFGEAFNQMYEFMSGGDLDIDSLSEKLESLGYSEAAIERAAEAITPFLEEAAAAEQEAATEKFNSDVGEAKGALSDYIFSNGITDKTRLEALLKDAGWSDEVVAEAMKSYDLYNGIYADGEYDEEVYNALEIIDRQIASGVLDVDKLIAAAKAAGISDEAIEEVLGRFGATKGTAVDDTDVRNQSTGSDQGDDAKDYILDLIEDGITDVDELYDEAIAGDFDEQAISDALRVLGVTGGPDDWTVDENGHLGKVNAANESWTVAENGYLGILQAERAEQEAQQSEEKFNSDVGSAYGFVLEAYQNGTAKTVNDLRTLLENSGNLSDDVIDEAISRFENVKDIIDTNKREFDVNSATSMILQAYLNGETDTSMLQALGETKYSQDVVNEAMSKLGTLFVAGQEKQKEATTKLIFNFMLDAMDKYEITDIQQLKDLAASLYGTDYLDDAAAMMEPWLKLGTDKLNEAKTESGVSMMLDMIANGESDMSKLKTYVAALLGEDVANAAAERLAPLASLAGEDVAKAQSQSAFAWMVDAYAKGTTDTKLLENMAKFLYGEDAVKAVSALFGEYVAADEKTRKDTLVFNAFEWMIDTYSSYDGDIDKTTLEKMATAIYGDKAIAKEASRKFDVFRQYLDGQSTASEEQLIYDAATMFGYNSDGEFSYTGSESDKEFIKRMLNTSTYSMYKPYADQIIAQLDADLAGMKGAEVEDIGGAFGSISENESWLSNPATSTMANYSATLEQYKQKYGINSKEYKDVLAAGSASIKDYILAATDDVDKLEEAGSWLGVDFADMDDADRLNAMLDGAGELHKQGYLTDGDYGTIIDEWLKGEVGLVSSETAFFELSQIAGRLEEYLDSGYLNKSMYNEKIASIAKSVTLSSGQFVGNTMSTITTPDGESIPLTANVFIKVNANGASTSSSWSVSAMSVYGLYNDDDDASALEQNIKNLYGNVGAAVPMYYEGHVYFWSKSGDLYRANMDEAYFERDGRKETKDQAKWSKQLIEAVVKNNSK